MKQMTKNIKKRIVCAVTVAVTLISTMPVFAGPMDYVATAKVNFRASASTNAEIIEVVPVGTAVTVTGFEDDWYIVSRNGVDGYMKAEFVVSKDEYDNRSQNSAELLTWSEAKGVFTVGVPAKITDVRTGLTYEVKSFSNGNHADVEPVTKADTQTMLQTYGGRWSWDTRPILVTINGRTVAASISGMPHGGGVNSTNGMDGQVCIHFKGSTTHNGNRSHEVDHQRTVMEAYNVK